MRALPDYLQPLEYLTQPFPKAAVQAAIERREESIPHLLESLAWVSEHPEEVDEAEREYMLHIFAMYLLAQFRESRALPSILRLFRLPQHEELTGGASSEGLDQILASTCGDDPAPLRALVEDRTADEWVRGAALQAVAILSECGVISRSDLSKYFIQLLAGRLEQEPGNYWDRLITICTDLRMHEFLEPIRQLYHAGIADPMYISLKEVETAIVSAPELPEHRQREFSMIDDTIAELGWWDCFQQKARQPKAKDVASPTAVLRSLRKIGRNDPCPCGSGLKHKKCCGKGG